jgi:hypothetical protein
MAEGRVRLMKIRCAMEDARIEDRESRIENGVDGNETAEGRVRLMKIRCAMEDVRIEDRDDGSETAEDRVCLMKMDDGWCEG